MLWRNSRGRPLNGPALAIIVALPLGGCLTNSSEVSMADASPTRYQSFTCQKLRTESYAVSAKATKLADVEDHNAVAAQISQLKGEMNAIEQAIIDKKCMR